MGRPKGRRDRPHLAALKRERRRLKTTLTRLKAQRLLLPVPQDWDRLAARLDQLVHRRGWRRDRHRRWLWLREGQHWTWTRIAAQDGVSWQTVKGTVMAFQKELTRWGETHE